MYVFVCHNKLPPLGGLRTTRLFSQSWRTEVQDQSVGGGGSSEASPRGVLMATFSLCPHVVLLCARAAPHVSLCVLVSSSYNDTRQSGLGATTQAVF